MPDVRDWGVREYRPALAEMRELRRARRAGAIPDTLILVEHPAVVTVGVQGPGDAPLPEGIPVVEVERGGHATYHGPGQLVGYPIVDLELRGRDVRRFVRDVEEIVIGSVAELGLRAGRLAGHRGVWVDDARKVASVGIAIEEWVSFHGFALNVGGDLGPFRAFRPCGLDGEVMTSVSAELGRPITPQEARPAVVRAWSRFPEASGPGAAAAPGAPASRAELAPS